MTNAADYYLAPPGFGPLNGIQRLPPVYLRQPSRMFDTHVSLGAWNFAMRLAGWLPDSVVLLAGDESIAITIGGKFAGILKRDGDDWVWQQ